SRSNSFHFSDDSRNFVSLWQALHVGQVKEYVEMLGTPAIVFQSTKVTYDSLKGDQADTCCPNRSLIGIDFVHYGHKRPCCPVAALPHRSQSKANRSDKRLGTFSQ